MQVLVVEPERRPEVREIDGSLKAMQDIVGGLIQSVYPFDEPVALVCNDEGRLMGLTANRALRDEEGQVYDIIFGTFFLCGASVDSDRFVGLTLEQVERYQERFFTPEMFWGVDGHIICFPIEFD